MTQIAKNGKIVDKMGNVFWYKNNLLDRDEYDENGHALPAAVYANGDKFWFKDDLFHRVDKDENGLTLPAIDSAEKKQWRLNDNLHRVDKDEYGLTLPATITSKGDREWWVEGLCHREDKDALTGLTLPAVERTTKTSSIGVIEYGKKQWFKNGKIHRDDKDENGLTLPAIESFDGKKQWYKNNVLHRDEIGPDGLSLPAIEECNAKLWVKNGVLHRIDGPAIVIIKTISTSKRETLEEDIAQQVGGNGVPTRIYNDFDRNRNESVGDDEIIDEQWYIDGVKIKKEEHPWFKAQRDRQVIEREINVLIKSEIGRQDTTVKRKVFRM